MDKSLLLCKKWPHLQSGRVSILSIVIPVTVPITFTIWKLFKSPRGTSATTYYRRNEDKWDAHTHSAVDSPTACTRLLYRMDKLVLFGFQGQITLRYMWQPDALCESVWWLASVESFAVLIAGICHEEKAAASLESWTLAAAWMIPFARPLELTGHFSIFPLLLLALPSAWYTLTA